MDTIKRFIYEEDGMEIIQVALILAIGIAIALAFKSQLSTLWTSIKDKIGSDKVSNIDGGF